MPSLSQQEIDEYLREVHVAHMVTVRPDGRPHVAPVWFMEEEGRAFVMADAGAVKVKNLRQNPQVALSIATDQRPFKYVVLQGEAETTKQDLPEIVERICTRYEGPERGRVFAEEMLAGDRLVLLEIRVARVSNWKDDD